MNGNAEKTTDRERMSALQKMEQMVNYVPVESIKEHLEVTRQGDDQRNDAELHHCIKRRSTSRRESSI